MWHRFILVILIVTFSLGAVAQHNVSTPDWLNKKMAMYQKSHPGIHAQLTHYDGKTAYYIPARCCDIASEFMTVTEI